MKASGGMVKNKFIFNFLMVIFLFIFIFQIKVNANNVEIEYTKDNSTFQEQNSKVITDLPVSIYEGIGEKSDSWNDKLSMIYFNKSLITSNLANKSKFILNEYNYIDLDVYNQKDTRECWAFSIYTSMQTNLLIKDKIKKDFSERHMDYATSNSFYDANNSDKKYTRSVKAGAITETGLAYLTNGQGAVLEEQMKFENDMNSISFSEIDIKPSYYVTDYTYIPNIFKLYDSDGNISYFNSFGKEYSENDIKNIRSLIKEYIVKNGALVAVTASEYVNGYNNTDDVTKANNFCCKDSTQVRDHAITIVGWDDNYDKENFNENNRPKSNGAYIVLQSYGEHFFNKGYMYISYEDSLIETSLYGISKSNKYDYDNLYQNDFYGANGTLYLKDYQVGYLSTYFSRDKSKREILTKVSVNIPQNAKLEVWVNPSGLDVSENYLKKISNDSKMLQAGYHTIDVTPTVLTGDNFAIVIKQISESGDFYFNVEYKQNIIFYENVACDKGRSKVSLDGKKWEVLDEQTEPLLKTADLCIKAFTSEFTNEPKL